MQVPECLKHTDGTPGGAQGKKYNCFLCTWRVWSFLLIYQTSMTWTHLRDVTVNVRPRKDKSCESSSLGLQMKQVLNNCLLDLNLQLLHQTCVTAIFGKLEWTIFKLAIWVHPIVPPSWLWILIFWSLRGIVLGGRGIRVSKFRYQVPPQYSYLKSRKMHDCLENRALAGQQAPCIPVTPYPSQSWHVGCAPAPFAQRPAGTSHVGALQLRPYGCSWWCAQVQQSSLAAGGLHMGYEVPGLSHLHGRTCCSPFGSHIHSRLRSGRKDWHCTVPQCHSHRHSHRCNKGHTLHVVYTRRCSSWKRAAHGSLHRYHSSDCPFGRGWACFLNSKWKHSVSWTFSGPWHGCPGCGRHSQASHSSTQHWTGWCKRTHHPELQCWCSFGICRRRRRVCRGPSLIAGVTGTPGCHSAGGSAERTLAWNRRKANLSKRKEERAEEIRRKNATLKGLIGLLRFLKLTAKQDPLVYVHFTAMINMRKEPYSVNCLVHILSWEPGRETDDVNVHQSLKKKTTHSLWWVLSSRGIGKYMHRAWTRLAESEWDSVLPFPSCVCLAIVFNLSDTCFLLYKVRMNIVPDIYN